MMKKLVIIGTVIPEPASTAAGTRMLQLMSLFQEMDYEICFLCTAKSSAYSYDLKESKVKVFQIELNNSSFNELLVSLNPEIVLFDRYITEEQFGWRVAEVCPQAFKVLDTEDLHFLRKARAHAFKKNEILKNSDLITDIFKREVAAVLRCDLSLIISEYEMALLQDTFNINNALLHYLPLFAEPVATKKSFSERANFISIGNFLHEPNWQTVLELKKIWPLIKSSLPKAELHIYGAYVPEKAQQLHHIREGFLIKGRAKSVGEVFEEARILLAPIPFGAGIKGKLLESMQYGLPNITSTIGAEGMQGNCTWNGAIKNDPQEFAAEAIRFYTDQKLWIQAQENGYEIIKKRFLKASFKLSFQCKIRNLLQSLPDHRNENFLGQILQHHALQSTKYMSKWISEKNKKL